MVFWDSIIHYSCVAIMMSIVQSQRSMVSCLPPFLHHRFLTMVQIMLFICVLYFPDGPVTLGLCPFILHFHFHLGINELFVDLFLLLKYGFLFGFLCARCIDFWSVSICHCITTAVYRYHLLSICCISHITLSTSNVSVRTVLWSVAYMWPLSKLSWLLAHF